MECTKEMETHKNGTVNSTKTILTPAQLSFYSSKQKLFWPMRRGKKFWNTYEIAHRSRCRQRTKLRNTIGSRAVQEASWWNHSNLKMLPVECTIFKHFLVLGWLDVWLEVLKKLLRGCYHLPRREWYALILILLCWALMWRETRNYSPRKAEIWAAMTLSCFVVITSLAALCSLTFALHLAPQPFKAWAHTYIMTPVIF